MFGAGRIGSYISQGVYTVSAPFHPFGGAVDIIVVEQEDGSYKSTPWYVRFGKFQGVLKATEKVVRINVNEADADFHMYLDDQGEAFFLEEVNAVEKEGESAVSYPSSGDEMEFKQKTMSCDIDKTIMVSEIEGSSKKSLTRNNSRRGEIFGLPIGRRSMKKNGLQSVEPHVEIDSANSLERAEIAADLLELRWSTNLCSGKSVNNVISDVKVDVVEPEFSYDKVDTHLSCSTNSDNSMEFIPGETCIESNIISVRSNVSQRVDNGCIKNDQNALSGFSKASHKADNENILGHASANEASFPKEYGTTESIAKCSGGEETLWTTSDVIVVDETGNSRCSIDEGINTDIVIKKKAVNGLPSENPPANESCETLTSMVHEMGSGELSAGANYLNSLPFVSENDCSVSNLRRPSLPSSAHHCIGNAMLEKTNSLTASYISNKDQFEFSDIDDPKVEKAEHIRTSPSDCGGYSCLGSLESSETAVFNTIIPDDTRQLTSKPTQVNSLANNPSFKFTLNRVSKPINISKALKDVDEEAMVPVAESLPNMQFDSNDLSVNVSQALGRFLDSTLEGFRKVSNEIPITSQISGVQQQVVFSQLTTDSTRISEVTQKNIADPPVEVSLCRHLLYEGMGYEAAACAFAAEKLIIDNILSLGPNNVEFDKLVVRVGGHYFPWDATMPISSAICSPGKEQILEPKNMIVVDRVDDYASEGVAQKSVNSQNGSWKLWPFSFKRSNSMKSRSSRFVASTESPEEIRRNGGAIVPRVAKTKLRTKVPSSEQLASLNLKEGKNVVKFTLSTAMLREQQVDARIFLWKRNAQIVISDVDGTITKSDVLGQFMPWMGMDWSQSGVTHLFSAIKENGYQLLFLSARSISQAYHTRQFLITLKQDGKALPEGPVLISPDGLFPSLYREVIRRAPHEFKIACLQDVKALFSPDQNPFYAGFGNRDTDELSYLKMGIPKGKIFTINPKGQVVVNRRVDSKSYTSLHTLVPDMFPPTNLHEQEDYNSWNFWRLPPPDGII